MIIDPSQDDIDKAFEGTNFGPCGKTPEGRKNLVVHCILKLTCEFADGYTIRQICKELGLLTKNGKPKKSAKRWAYRCIAEQLRNN